MARHFRRPRGGLRPALWLTADAALAALIAWPAEALLLFLLNPDLPFTLRGFGATMVALAPQVLVVFVLVGPALVLFATSLAVGRSTRLGLSVRYILRFALLDAVVLAAAAVHQWRSLRELLPDPARTALALTATALAVVAGLALVLVIFDLRRPKRLGAPWVLALGIAVLVPLGIAGDLRRVRVATPHPIQAPGFEPARGLLLVEIPGLDEEDLDRGIKRGSTPALEAFAAAGARFHVDGRPLVDPVALHATLVTGQPPLRHGVLAAVRYRPMTWNLSFGVFPRGLLVRPLLLTSLWRRTPVGGAAVRAVALPGIAESLGLSFAMVGDPLGWPSAGPFSLVVPRTALDVRGPVQCPGLGLTYSCPGPPLRADQLFDPPAPDLPTTPRLAREAEDALAEDTCALGLGRALLASPSPPQLLVVRLAGYGRVAWQFAGWRSESPARGATDQEIAAYGRTMARHLRALDPALGRLFEAGKGRLVALVAPLGVRARQDVGRVGAALLGASDPTGTFAGPPPGLVILVGEGVRGGERLEQTAPLTAVLPTLLWAEGLPAAEDMGPIVRTAFRLDFVEAHPVVTLPTFSAQPVR